MRLGRGGPGEFENIIASDAQNLEDQFFRRETAKVRSAARQPTRLRGVPTLAIHALGVVVQALTVCLRCSLVVGTDLSRCTVYYQWGKRRFTSHAAVFGDYVEKSSHAVGGWLRLAAALSSPYVMVCPCFATSMSSSRTR